MLLTGRGDNNIKIYSLDESGNLVYQEKQQFAQTQKSFCMMPKHVCNVQEQEVLRGCRVLGNSNLEVTSMRIPSKIGGFNESYYPPFFANEPSSTAEAWCNGNDVPAKTMQLSMSSGSAPAKAKKGGLSKLKT